MKIFRFVQVLVFMRAEWGNEKGVKSVEISDSNQWEQQDQTVECAAILSCVQVYGVPAAHS